MGILFCKVGWSTSYNGNILDKPINGGAYNKNQIGHEIHNYKSFNGTYFGYVQSVGDSIRIEKIGGTIKDNFVNNILIVWVSTKKAGGQVIVGWYKNATVYRNHQNVPLDAMEERVLKDHNFFNIKSNDVYLLPEDERVYAIKGFGQSNVWYGNEDTNKQVEDYINKYTEEYDNRIFKIESKTSELIDTEREVIVKARINQDKYREDLLKKYGKCCLCGVQNQELLIASHLKPWSKSDKKEKLDIENGLLLCPNHDKLVNNGFISFDDTGKILISNKLSETDRIFMNIKDDMKIKITDNNAPYILYHRLNVFRK